MSQIISSLVMESGITPYSGRIFFLALSSTRPECVQLNKMQKTNNMYFVLVSPYLVHTHLYLDITLQIVGGHP